MLKSRLRPMRGLKRHRSARILAAGHAFMQNLRRGHYDIATDTPNLSLRAAQRRSGIAKEGTTQPSTLLDVEPEAATRMFQRARLAGLGAGLWPVHPFTEPSLVMLGDQLPFHWRELNQLQRRHLAAFGLSDEACNFLTLENLPGFRAWAPTLGWPRR